MTALPLVFDCGGDQLLGILHAATSGASRGAVIVVGGPQYRVGSHRHFYLLAQELSEAGFPTLRFDYRGMGDSDGEFVGFENISEDIRAAVDQLFEKTDNLDEVVLIGLCDAASAVMMYAENDARIGGMVLMNPWVRSEESHARATVKHYYRKRLVDRELWQKILRGQFAWRESLTSLRAMLVHALPGQTSADEGSAAEPYQVRMCKGLAAFPGSTLLITSGDDLTAAEFLDSARSSSAWQAALARPKVTHRTLAEANHTFASARWRRQVNDWITGWMRSW